MRIALFHSVFGLRDSELSIADTLRTTGHEVSTPDLYAGEVAATIEAGFELSDRIGWATIAQRANEALQPLPADTVLAGISMGAYVAASVLAERPDAAGLLLLHAAGDMPPKVRAGLPAQLHIADPDSYAPAENVTTWETAAVRAGAQAEVFRYPGVGHFYTAEDSIDYNEAAAALTWQRSLAFLAEL